MRMLPYHVHCFGLSVCLYACVYACLCVCVCVCVCVCMHICIYACACCSYKVHVLGLAVRFVCICVYAYIRTRAAIHILGLVVCVCVYACPCTCKYTRIRATVARISHMITTNRTVLIIVINASFIYACVYVCVYVCTCVYIHLSIKARIYIFVLLLTEVF